MELGSDDPRLPLLGCVHYEVTQTESRPSQFLRRNVTCICNWNSWRRRIPLLKWVKNYSFSYLLRDAIAGTTVGLTSIPQGIAYAIIAGLPPQWGLYSSMFPGVVYMILGSCKEVVVGPTAILAVLVSKYVAYNADFAILAAFLSGCIICLLGLLNLGFVLDFISKPAIGGFTTAAALQIAASQLKSLFRLSGPSGSTFIEAVVHFIKNIKTIYLWDSVLGFVTIGLLIIFKRFSSSTSSCSPGLNILWKHTVRARNALVVAFGVIVAYCVHYFANLQPFALTGKIEGGLPKFALPPFSTTVKNETCNFADMLSIFGAEGLVMPLVAILESIAIAKAFAGSTSVDASQEMVAVGACNIICAFCPSMPVTGSFTRTAINHHSDVATPAGGLFKGLLVLLSVSLLAPTFAWIPRATLAAVIIVAMLSIVTLDVVPLLWRHSKSELLVFAVTALTGACAGLEYGIVAGAITDLLRLMYVAAKPNIPSYTYKVGNTNCVFIQLQGNLSYCCTEYFTNIIRSHVMKPKVHLVLDGRHLRCIDVGVAENLLGIVNDLEKKGHTILLWHFQVNIKTMLQNLNPRIVENFTDVSNIDESIFDSMSNADTIPLVD